MSNRECPKQEIAIPEMLKISLQEDGWICRQTIIWHKPNPMPESVRDRCTKAHEYIFLLSKSKKYFYDADAVREPIKANCDGTIRALARDKAGPVDISNGATMQERVYDEIKGANKRSVWTVTTKPFTGWSETSHLVPVALGAVSDGMKHIVSPNCQQHEGLFEKVSSGFYGELAVDFPNHNSRIYSRLSQELQFCFVPTGQTHGGGNGVDSLGLILRRYFPFAIGRNKEIHKMVLGLLTNPSYSFFVETLSRTDGKLALLLFSVLQMNNHDHSILPDGMDARLLDQIPYRTVHKSSLPVPPNCFCSFYQVKTEKSSHFATFPEDLIKPCILAGCPKGGTVLDPFFGAGTTGVVTKRFGRNCIGIELNTDYIKIAEKRINNI